MTTYMLVLVDTDDDVVSDTEFFNLLSDAEEKRDEQTHIDGCRWVVMECEEVEQ